MKRTHLNWLVTAWLHSTAPVRFGPLVGGMNHYIIADIGPLRRANTLALAAAYVALLVLTVVRARTARDLCLVTTAAALAYFLLGYGVHENHSYIAVITAVSLALVCPSRSTYLIVGGVSLLHVLNLALFYGLTGRDSSLHNTIAHIDPTVGLAVIALGLYGVFLRWLWLTVGSRDTTVWPVVVPAPPDRESFPSSALLV